MIAAVAGQLALLKTASTPDLKQRWRELFQSEPPPYNRRFLESRLAYRIQELAEGGLRSTTVERLNALGDDIGGGSIVRRRTTANRKPIAGTILVREWQGVEHRVTVTVEGFEYCGRPYRSISAVARAISGTRWNAGPSSA